MWRGDSRPNVGSVTEGEAMSLDLGRFVEESLALRERGPWPRFVAVPDSIKVACAVCGKAGMGPLVSLGDGGSRRYTPWQLPHLGDHEPCPDCGKPFTSRSLHSHRQVHRKAADLAAARSTSGVEEGVAMPGNTDR